MRRDSGFTLVEILVAICIIAILTAVLIPVARHLREKKARAVCQSKLRAIALALHMYADDSDEMFPCEGGPNVRTFTGKSPEPLSGLRSLRLLYPTYVYNHRLFQCPAAPRATTEDFKLGRVRAMSSSYAYDPRHRATHPGSVVLLGDWRNPGANRIPAHRGAGGNFCFGDAHVEWRDAAGGLAPKVGDPDTDDDIWAPGPPDYEHDTCLVK